MRPSHIVLSYSTRILSYSIRSILNTITHLFICQETSHYVTQKPDAAQAKGIFL